jgi:hypothetical protein
MGHSYGPNQAIAGRTGPVSSLDSAGDEPHGLQAGGGDRARSCQIAQGTARIGGYPQSTSRVTAGSGHDTLAPVLPKLQMSPPGGPLPSARARARTSHTAWRPRPGWAAVTLVIAAFFAVGLVESLRLIVVERAWWNVPGMLLSLALIYWVGIAAQRCIWTPDDRSGSGPETGHTAGPKQDTSVP